MENELSIAFTGGSRRAAMPASRAAGKVCAVRAVHVIDINEDEGGAPQRRKTTRARVIFAPLAHAGRLFAAATRNMPGVVPWTRQSLRDSGALTCTAVAGRGCGLAEAGGK